MVHQCDINNMLTIIVLAKKFAFNWNCLCPLSFISMPVKRSIMTKSLQFNTEPQKENITESQGLEYPVPSSLSYLIGQVAETAEEKYRFLEQRDKVLRQGKATSYCGLFHFSAWHEQTNT